MSPPKAGAAPVTKPVVIKVVLLGEGHVGKTSLLARFIHDTFREDRQATVQAAFMAKQLTIDGQQVEVALWDTAGQERFHSLAPLYYRDAHAALLVYDITDRESLDRVRHWVKELRAMAGDIVLAILGNKVDLPAREQTVPEEEARSFAESIGAAHCYVSAKTGQGIEAAVSGAVRHALAAAHARPPGTAAAGGRREGGLVIADMDWQTSRKQAPCC